MAWVQFLVSAAVIVYAAIKLAEYGDVIAIRTRLGGMFIGLILMAGATSLPELLTSINSIQQGVPDLAGGSMFGSNLFNMLLLGFIDLLNWRVRILRKVARKHALSGSIATLMIALATVFLLADIDLKIGWVGLDSLIIIAAYIAGLWVIRSDAPTVNVGEEEIDSKMPSLRKALFGFSLATAALVAVMPLLVSASKEIAETTGLGTGFVGTALVAMVTSLPELVTTITAVRMGVYDLAIGNLFGSNMFNMFALGLSDFFMTDGRFMAAINVDFALVGIIGLIMTLLGLIGNLAKLERKILIFEIDATLLILCYFLGMWLIYLRGIGI